MNASSLLILACAQCLSCVPPNCSALGSIHRAIVTIRAALLTFLAQTAFFALLIKFADSPVRPYPVIRRLTSPDWMTARPVRITPGRQDWQCSPGRNHWLSVSLSPLCEPNIHFAMQKSESVVFFRKGRDASSTWCLWRPWRPERERRYEGFT